MTRKEKLETLISIVLTTFAIIFLLLGVKTVSLLLFGLVLFIINAKWVISKIKNKLW